MADHPNFWEDIYPLLTRRDLACMGARPTPVPLTNVEWWKADGNFDHAYRRLQNHTMPLGGAKWGTEALRTLAAWKENGFPEGPKPWTE